jgi:hypothetical protein
MQPTVQAVFVVVTSVIATLLTLGLGGILTMLYLDRDTTSHHAVPAGTAADAQDVTALPRAA